LRCFIFHIWFSFPDNAQLDIHIKQPFSGLVWFKGKTFFYRFGLKEEQRKKRREISFDLSFKGNIQDPLGPPFQIPTH
jgi:hypothetical protein